MVITNLTFLLLFSMGTVEPGDGWLVSQQQALLMFKKPSHLYNFKEKVLLAMKLRYLMVTGCGMLSGNVVSGNEDVPVVDHLAVKLFQEMQLV
jgi:hypothetical protein